MENKISRYLKYAIGEIILVVIGILIALSLNNWNSQRLNANRNKVLLQKLSKELDLNIERALLLKEEGYMDGFDGRALYADSVFNILSQNKVTDHLDYIVKDFIFYVNAFNLNTSVFEELKNTGSLYSIGSDSLVTEIQRYYQLCDRESFYNLEYSEDVNILKFKCYDGWYDFVHIYKSNPEEALSRHPWISNPKSTEFIEFRQFIHQISVHSNLIARKLKGIVKESEDLKQLISSELNGNKYD
jgi:hypothetical protein